MSRARALEATTRADAAIEDGVVRWRNAESVGGAGGKTSNKTKKAKKSKKKRGGNPGGGNVGDPEANAEKLDLSWSPADGYDGVDYGDDAPRKRTNENMKFVPPDAATADGSDLDDTGDDRDDEYYDGYIERPLGVSIPRPQKRCPYVIQTFQQQNEGVADLHFLREKYAAQSVNPNVFYRATALLFWKDFGAGHWGADQNKSISLPDLVLLHDAKYEDGTPMSPMSTWTWITGDQHLSNFGAWRNRGKEVVFSVNDFDEAAVFDFHVDVLRIAVSICDHGFDNGLDVRQVREALEAFTYAYVKTTIDYVGGDAELLFELNPRTSTGMLRDFLWDVEEKKSATKQMQKFTELGSDGARRFVRNEETRLIDVTKEVEDKIRAEINSKKYGATMMKMGWKVRGWDDDFFTVLDVARRVDSGIGSYGVDRYYVLLKGKDTSLDEDDENGASVILDVKYEPASAVARILDEDTKAWYACMFNNEADRAAQGQRRLTSYTDPFVGWIEIDGNSYSVRQRSPWKDSFDLETLTNHRAFVEFIEQIAIATATSVSHFVASFSSAFKMGFEFGSILHFSRYCLWA